MGKEDGLEVSLRGGFSDRMGLSTINTEIQLNEFDKRTRVALVNGLDLVYSKYIGEEYVDGELNEFIADVLGNVYNQIVHVDRGHYINIEQLFSKVNYTILNDSYHAVLTVIEYVAQRIEEYRRRYDEFDLYEHFNSVFEKEYVGYRFLNRIIVPISNEHEVSEIRSVMLQPYEEVRTHIEKALERLADRTKPDYENSIKESISAVEAICNTILGHTGTLGDSLKKLEKQFPNLIHPTLKDAFIKLFGYTSDAKGVRHAGNLGGNNSTFPEARFMLVTCSAFVNYLIANMPSNMPWCVK